VRVTGEGVGDQLPDQGDRLGGGFVTRDLALVAAATVQSGALIWLAGFNPKRQERAWCEGSILPEQLADRERSRLGSILFAAHAACASMSM
jgi:hypothetical protein